MERLILVRFMVRAFGLLLFVQSVASLPNVVLRLVSGAHSSFVEVFFAGALPFIIPPVAGLLMFWNPDGVLRMQRNAVEPDGRVASLNIEVVAISLLGLYWLVMGAIDTIYQFSWGVMTKENSGRFFETYDAIAATISAVLELTFGAAITYYADSIQAKLLALRARRRGASGADV